MIGDMAATLIRLPVVARRARCAAALAFALGMCPTASADQAAAARAGSAPVPVRFPTRDGGVVHADLYGAGPRGVVLAHGGRFNKGSWAKQAGELAAAGFRVLAFDFRGYGESRGPGQKDIFTAPLHLDVLAAVRYLRETGATRVDAIGGSLGGGAAASAAIAEPRSIDRLILLGSTPDGSPEALAVRKLYITTRDDTSGDGPRLPGLLAHYERAPQPKELIILEGSAHAQFMFDTDLAERVMREIRRFLTEP
jgi:pimeloyl-ACP methyl ester carboxylesterase